MGQIIGMIDHDSELGYWLDPRYWGRGLMAEAAHAVLTAYFNHPDAAPMWSVYYWQYTLCGAVTPDGVFNHWRGDATSQPRAARGGQHPTDDLKPRAVARR